MAATLPQQEKKIETYLGCGIPLTLFSLHFRDSLARVSTEYLLHLYYYCCKLNRSVTQCRKVREVNLALLLIYAIKMNSRVYAKPHYRAVSEQQPLAAEGKEEVGKKMYKLKAPHPQALHPSGLPERHCVVHTPLRFVSCDLPDTGSFPPAPLQICQVFSAAGTRDLFTILLTLLAQLIQHPRPLEFIMQMERGFVGRRVSSYLKVSIIAAQVAVSPW